MRAALRHRLILSAADRLPPLSTRKILLAILSGVMLTATFPPGDLEWMAWFALVPLFKSLQDEPPSRAIRLGLMAGIVHYLTLLYWIVVAVGHYGNLNPILSAGVLFLLCIYMALYFVAFSVLFFYFESSRFFLISIASLWIGLEYVRAHLLTGFPWCLLGYTQFQHLHLIQVADLCGVYGLSFLVILANGMIYRLIFQPPGKIHHIIILEFLMTALLASGTFLYGHYRLTKEQKGQGSRPYVQAAVIQGNIDQSVKWNPSYQSKTISIYERLTRAVHNFKPQLIVWPETSVPFFFQDNLEYSPRVLSLSKELESAIIFGSPAYQKLGEHTRYYNRAYLATPDGRGPRYYDKVHLLPFGEYVPLRRLLFFVGRLVPAAGDFQPGDRVVPLRHGNLSMGILICYEAIFPELARTHAQAGANILVNLTNDAWFGMTSAPHQHLCMSALRAVENRIPMIRAANTGISAIIGPQGKIIQQSELFTEAVLKGSVPMSKRTLTVYARFGDLFAIAMLITAFLATVYHLSFNQASRHPGRSYTY